MYRPSLHLVIYSNTILHQVDKHNIINSQYINIKTVQQWATSSTSWLLFIFCLQQVYRHLSGSVWSKGVWSVWNVSYWEWRCVILHCIVLSGVLCCIELYRVERGVVLYWIVSCWSGRCVIVNCIVLSGVLCYIELYRVERGAVLYWIVSCWAGRCVILNCIVLESGVLLYWIVERI
jgi:hypothetical protein